MRCVLMLEDGFFLEGEAFAGEGEAYGEVVFNTSMTGYQEIITDPSYKGQIVAFTYPLIGNYGVNDEDVESTRPQAEAVIVRECSRLACNWRSTGTLREYLEAHRVLGMEGADTRALTRHIREVGAMRGVVSTTHLDPAILLDKVRSYPGLVGRDMVRHVTCAREYAWNASGGPRVVVFDFGVKRSILRMLAGAGCQVTVVPAYTCAEYVLAKNPDGILLSNGPGDPEGVPSVVSEVRKLLGKKPVFGICLGHQVLGLALGLKTSKLKFGHRGANHPVKVLQTGKVEITSQNHGFCVELPPEAPGADRAPAEAATAGATAGAAAEAAATEAATRDVTAVPGGSLPDLRERVIALTGEHIEDLGLDRVDLHVTHVNLDDHTLEGMDAPDLAFFSVQYHPEASPGPHDSRYLFRKFHAMMQDGARRA